MNVAYSPEAKHELLTINDWYERHAREGVAQRFAEALSDVLEKVRNHPERFPRYRATPSIAPERWAQIPDFPYLIIFEQFADDAILILAITHHRRLPGDWRK